MTGYVLSSAAVLLPLWAWGAWMDRQNRRYEQRLDAVDAKYPQFPSWRER